MIAFLPTILFLFTPFREGERGGFYEQEGFLNKFLFKLKSLTPLQRINISFIALWIVAIILTLSRSAILIGALILIFLNRNYIKTHKKALIRGGVGLIGIIALLSVLKRESTL
ncbi:MAG: hypothetical protein LBI53_07525 [Candidatus Peribacteria bacterium]|nr:hypothetical protein [Candidatus Peribacteria bacterium]